MSFISGRFSCVCYGRVMYTSDSLSGDFRRYLFLFFVLDDHSVRLSIFGLFKLTVIRTNNTVGIYDSSKVEVIPQNPH